jgi:hypothetical protein
VPISTQEIKGQASFIRKPQSNSNRPPNEN